MENFNKCLIVISLISVQQFVSTERAAYGETCNKLLRCDSKASLMCGEDNICRCIMSEKMTFDDIKGKCVTMAGEKCVYTAVEMSDDTAESEAKKWREELECVSMASCSSDGYCTCNKGYFEDSNSTCEEKHSYGESCEMDSHCKENFHLVCSTNKTCNCNGSTSYDITKQKCVGRVGSLCLNYPECVANAECPPKRTVSGVVPTTTATTITTSRRPSTSRNSRNTNLNDNHSNRNNMNFGVPAVGTGPDAFFPTRNIIEILEYTTETCSCRVGFTSADDGTCLLTYGGVCDYHDASKRCLPGMICREGICDCKYQSMQLYNTSTLKCDSLIGGPCSESGEGCIDHADCVDSSNQKSNETADGAEPSVPMHCQCRKGFIEVNQRCEIEYGQECGLSVSGDTKCDSIAPLHCIEGSCQCNFLEYYDEEVKRCRGLEGALCNTESENFCTVGATCVSYRSKTVGIGQCVCKDNPMSSITRRCGSSIKGEGS